MTNFSDELTYGILDNRIRFEIGGISTNWMNRDDSFIGRIDADNINPIFSKEHLIKEIKIKNRLDEGITFLNSQKYAKSIICFDEVIYYDEYYGEGLINKSRALKGQGHFVKALRYYKKAIAADDNLRDIEYHKSLLKESNEERSNFPKLKQNIYEGDEFFSKREFERAVESYDKALLNPSKFKDKILFKLLNKKGTALFMLDRFEEAHGCFLKSLRIHTSDYATYFNNVCQFKLTGSIGDGFKMPLKIDKSQTLNQVRILNDLKFFKESLAICDDYLENFFIVDGNYRGIVDCKVFAMGKLGLEENFKSYF